MTPRLRIYCETLPWEDLLRPEVVALLVRHALGLVLAVRPWQIEDLPRVALVLADAGVPLAIWPMLSDDQGRWANAKNARAFARLVRITDNALVAARAPATELLFDVEPPFAEARALASSIAGSREHLLDLASGGARLRAKARAAFAEAEAELGGVAREVRERGAATPCAVWPLVALDPPNARGWQAVLGTPVDALEPDRVSVMMYTSIFEGWSRGALRREDATLLLDAACRRTTRRWGARAGISLGCVGTGAFEDEPIYRAPEELAVDVAIARAAGCDALSLFDLGGVLARPPAEAWLEAFASTARDVALPTPSRRVTAARTLARAATWVLAPRETPSKGRAR